jgi:hypothetical protein
MKRRLIALFTILLSVSLIATYSCKKEKDKSVAVTEVRLDKTATTLVEGDTEELMATVMPENATDKGIEWKSDNESVATVSQAGLVTALKEGSSAITVITNDGGLKATCDVTVNKKTIAVLEVQLNKKELTLTEGGTEKLVVTVKPDDATDKSVVWESSSTAVATVDQEGLVTAVGEGKATITVKTNDGGFSASCEVTVKKKVIAVTGVKLSAASMTLREGDKGTLTATVEPANATNKNVEWWTSDLDVVSVTSTSGGSNGYVEARGAGKATVTVKTEDGEFSASCEITVEKKEVPVTGIALEQSSLLLPVGNTYTLRAHVQPSNATDQDIQWGSSNGGVATVDQTGKVTAVAAGTVDILATLAGKFARCTVQVDNVKLSMKNSSYMILPRSKPINIESNIDANFELDHSKLSFSYSDPEVATIGSDFYIETHGKKGTTKVNVLYKYGNGELKTSFTITVQ